MAPFFGFSADNKTMPWIYGLELLLFFLSALNRKGSGFLNITLFDLAIAPGFLLCALLVKIRIIREEPLPDSRSFEKLMDALNSNNFKKRLKAIKTLGFNRETNAIDVLVKAMYEDDYYISNAAAESLGRINTATVVLPLAEAWDGAGAVSKDTIESALSRIDDPEAVGPLTRVLENYYGDLQHILREAAVKALGNINDPATVEPLIAALNDENIYVRCYATEELGKKKEPRAVEPLTALLNEKNPENSCMGDRTRRTAVEALGTIDSPATVEPLIYALNDEDAFVREQAAAALGEKGDHRAVSPLEKACHDEDPSVREAAAEALEKIKNI